MRIDEGRNTSHDAITALVDGVHRSWSTYITWYTAFFIANLLVWTWMVSGNRSSSDKAAICWVWMILDVSGICTVAVLGRYAFRAYEHVRGMLSEEPNSYAELLIPRSLSNWAAVGNIFTFLVLIAGWAFLLVAR